MRKRRLSLGKLEPLASAKPAIYSLSGGVLYARCSLAGKEILRRSATIVLTASGKPVELHVAGERKRYGALAIKPLVRHTMYARNVGLVSLLIYPDHPHYSAFRAIPDDGRLPIKREHFVRFDRQIDAAYRGTLTLKEAQRLFDHIVAATIELLPPARPLDARMYKVMRLLKKDPDYPLVGIADAVGISYHRMSHVFADSIGLPLRSYRLWQKEANVAPLLEGGATLKHAAANAGFRDAMHLCRVFRQAYGAPPSYIYKSDATHYFSADSRGRPPRPGTPRKKG